MVIPTPLEVPVDEATLYRDLFLTLPLGQCLLDGTGRILVTNPAADRLFETSAGSLRGRAIADLIDAPAASMAARVFGRSARADPLTFPAQARLATGQTFPIEMAVVRIRAGPPALYGALFRDLRETPRGPGAAPEYTVAELLMANRLRELV